MISVLVPIADGIEELEAVTIIDVLRRAEANVDVASVMPGRKHILASRKVKLHADYHLDDCEPKIWDAIVLPGGMPGAENLQKSEKLRELLQAQIAENRWVGAICASPAVVLGRHNLIADRTATCYPGFQQELQDNVAHLAHKRVVVDGHLVTSQGPGTAMEFALELVSLMIDEEKAAQVAAGMLYNY